MIIGFDFDKVFINYPPFVPYKLVDFLYKGKGFLKKRKLEEGLSYRFPGKIEQKVRILSHTPVLRRTIKKNIEALEKIRKNNHFKTYLVSSRFGFLQKRTDEIMNKHELSKFFNGVYFNFDNQQPHLFKEETIKKLRIDTYIDDDLDLLFYLSSKLPKLRFFWLKNGRKESIRLPKNITPIVDLSQFLRYL